MNNKNDLVNDIYNLIQTLTLKYRLLGMKPDHFLSITLGCIANIIFDSCSNSVIADQLIKDTIDSVKQQTAKGEK